MGEDVATSPAIPAKKMKQSRLPFAPINKIEDVANSNTAGSNRKRKLSNSTSAPVKTARTEEKEYEYDPPGLEYVKDSLDCESSKSTQGIINQNVTGPQKENAAKRDIQSKKAKDSKPDAEVEPEVILLDDDSVQEVSDHLSGRVKFSFKKKKKSTGEKDSSNNSDVDLDGEVGIEQDCSSQAQDETSKPTKKSTEVAHSANVKSVKSKKSGKQKVEKNPNDAQSQQKKKVKCKGASSQSKIKPEEKEVDPESSKKSTEASTSGEGMKKAVTQTSVEAKSSAKSSPLAKFLVKVKPGVETPKSKTSNPELDTLQSPAADESCNLNGSKSADSCISTPNNSTSKETPASIRASKIAEAKIKVKIQEVTIEMEQAVKEENFLKAHELKQQILKLEDKLLEVPKGAVDTSETLPEKSDVSTPTTGDNCSTTTATTTASTPSASKAVAKATTPSSSTGSSGSTPTVIKKALTPKQLLLQEERRKKAAMDKEEKEKKRQEKQEQKERQKEIEKRVKEAERLERERSKRMKEQEKEAEKLRKKLEKEDEVRKKEEERLHKEEERLKKEAAENEKKRKAAEAFKGFFVKKDVTKERAPSAEEKTDEVSGGKFNPFQVKMDMRLAPVVRSDPARAKANIDGLEEPAGPQHLYLEILRSGNHNPGKQGKTWPWEKTVQHVDSDVEVIEPEDEEEDEEETLSSGCDSSMVSRREGGVMIIEGRQQQAIGEIPRAKLLQFHANQRPAYWGTWSKRSQLVTGRRPFHQDKQVFDYEYDSDEDWEDEGEGESLSDDDNDDKEEEDDYEVDNGFLVPHGYLSDGEEDKDEDEVFNPEKEKEKLKLKEQEFQAEYNKKTQQLKPRLWGCYWENNDDIDTGVAASQLARILTGYAAIPCCNNNIPVTTAFSKVDPSPTPNGGEEFESAKSKGRNKVAKTFPEEALPDLVRLVHINSNNKVFLSTEFTHFWRKKTEGDVADTAQEDAPITPVTPTSNQISKRKLVDKIQEIAEYKKLDGKPGRWWVVKEDILDKVGHLNRDNNTWTYILEQPNAKNGNSATSTPATNIAGGGQEGGDGGEGTSGGGFSRPNSPLHAKSNGMNSATLITKFTKVLTDEERAKLNSTPPSAKRCKLYTLDSQYKPNPIKVKRTPGSAVAAGSSTSDMKNTPTSTATASGGCKSKTIVNMIGVKRKTAAASSTPTSASSAVGGNSSAGQVKPVAKANLSIKSFVKQSASSKTAGASTVAVPIATRKTPKSEEGDTQKQKTNGGNGGQTSEDCITLD